MKIFKFNENLDSVENQLEDYINQLNSITTETELLKLHIDAKDFLETIEDKELVDNFRAEWRTNVDNLLTKWKNN